MAYLGMPDPGLYRRAIRSPVDWYCSVDAAVNGVPTEGAQDLRPVGGSIIDTTRPGVRRTLNLELASAPGLFDRLAPTGTTLTARTHVRLANRSWITIPMGVFDVDREQLDDAGGGLSLTAPDKWRKIQRARFIVPTSSTPGLSVTGQITALIRGALGSGEPVITRTKKTNRVGLQTWEKDRDQAIIKLADGIGCWVYFDRNGVATIDDVPTAARSADWLVDSSRMGVLTALDRQRSRESTRNVVVVSSSATEGELFPTQVVWDDDPSSPTYAGPDPLGRPDLAGPFGVVTYYWDTPLPMTANQARDAGRTILSRVTGLASQVSLGQVPNPAVDAMDALDVLPARERYDLPRAVERHIADTVTHPLTVDGGAQRIEGRSTRTEEIEGGS
ncbi:hypothetical protein [Geodermatophilus chilensis]|uniref:hypothetical protein n=1 Tax=Geodermatophilus chilensis TaxID=2035835 RepID=UPI000C266E5A|nr:hypothetical protein [Geodermatophilus chilensis]